MARYYIFFICCSLHTTLYGQLPKSAFSIQLWGAYSLSHAGPANASGIGSHPVRFMNPQINYNLLLKHQNIFEAGIALHNLGNQLNYYNSAGQVVNSVDNSNQVIALPLSYYQCIDRRNHLSYLGVGALFAWNFTGTVFQNITPDYNETTAYQKGFKPHITASYRSFFQLRQRHFCLQLQYVQGLNTYYKTDVIFFNGNPGYQVLHRGSAIQIGLSYFFLKKEKEE